MSQQQDYFIECMGCGVLYDGISQFCSRNCMNSSWFSLQHPIYVDSDSDSETIQLTQSQMNEMIDRTNKRQGDISPSKYQTANKQVQENKATVAKFKHVKGLWQHKDIFVPHHMQGDTIVLHDE